MLASFNNVSFTSNLITARMRMSDRAHLALEGRLIPRNTLASPRRIIKTQPLRVSNPADYEIIPHGVKMLDDEARRLFFRGLIAQTEEDITKIRLLGKAREFGVTIDDNFHNPLEEEEKKLLATIKTQLASFANENGKGYWG